METFLNRKNLGRELKTRQTAQRALLIEALGQLRPIVKQLAGRFLASPLTPLKSYLMTGTTGLHLFSAWLTLICFADYN
jgi:hypothetical protein